MVQHPRRESHTYVLPWEPKTSHNSNLFGMWCCITSHCAHGITFSSDNLCEQSSVTFLWNCLAVCCILRVDEGCLFCDKAEIAGCGALGHLGIQVKSV
jgi:hypothetical protein